jgi:hypothetical protein
VDVFALCTPSHQGLLEGWFLRTLPGECRANVYFVDAEPMPPATGQWHRVVGRKFDVLERAFAETAPDTVFVMSDVDVRFYRPFAAELLARMRGKDILFQNNWPGAPFRAEHLCSGFMAVRNNSAARTFFQTARRLLELEDRPEVGDQFACIEALRASSGTLCVGVLPDTYWVPPRTGAQWEPGQPLEPPAGLVLHHANRSAGPDRKALQLQAVEEVLAQRGWPAS